MPQQVFEFGHGIMIDTIAGTRPLYFTLNQTGGLQYLEMLADRGLGQWQHLHQLTAHTLVDLFQMSQNMDACRMGQCLAYRRQTIRIQKGLFYRRF